MTPAATAFMADWLHVLADATARGSVIIGVAAVVAWCARRRAAAVRSVSWHLVAGVIVALPLVSGVLPRWRIDAPQVVSESRAAIASRFASRATSVGGAPGESRIEAATPSDRATGAPFARVAEPNANDSVSWLIAVLFALWAAGASVAVGQVALSLCRIVRIARRSRAADATVVARVAESLPGVSIPARVRVLEGPPHIAPMTWGFLRPRVLMPAGWDRWPESVAAAALAHELAHVRRHDLARQLPWDFARTMFWFNPLIAYAAGQSRLASEQACDDDVVGRGLAPTKYADALLLLVRELRGAGTARVPALGGGGNSELAKRITAVVDPSRPRHASRTLAGVTVLFVALVSGVTASASIATETDPDVTVQGARGRALDSAFAVLGARGLSGTVLVATDHGVIFAKAYGFADRSRRAPATVSTRYHVAGIAKAFTAAAVVDLIDRGLVSADVPVRTYLPELGGDAGRVTVHQLLTHTDGLSGLRGLQGDAQPSAFLAALGSAQAVFAPGSSYGSTDVGHSVLAALVERVAGRPFEAHLRSRLLDPAGMTRSFFRSERPGGVEGTAVGYAGDVAVAPATDAWGVRGSRGLVTTVYDLHRWYAALASGRLVRQSALDRMFTPYWRTDKPFEQGYGWLLYDDRAVLPFRGGPIAVRRRSGREPGFEAEMVHDPNGVWFAAVLLNTDDGRRLDAIDAIRTVMNAHPPPGSAIR